MKFRLLIAVLILASTGAFVFSRAAFAQTGTTGSSTTPTATLPAAMPTNTGSSSNLNANNGCQLIDPETAAAQQGSSSSSSSGTGSSVPVTGATATVAPTATTATSGGAASTPAATATMAPTATLAPTSTQAPTASQSPTATSATSGGTSGSTGNTGNTGNAATDPHENPYCVGFFRLDIAGAAQNSATVTMASASALNAMNEPFNGLSNNANSSNGSTSANGQGSIPVTGSSASGTTGLRPLYRFNAYDANALAGSQAVTVNVGGNNGVAHMEVCAADPSGSASIYMWFSTSMWSTWFKSSTTPARWVKLPTTHTGSMACTQSWLSGTYAVH